MQIASLPFNTVYNLRQFDPAVEKPGTFGTETQLNDLAVVEQPQITTPASSLSPIVVFNNPGDVTAFFDMLKNQTITLSGQSSPQGVTGTFASATVAGQFNGSFSQPGDTGDSGGSASVQNKAGTNYVVGITAAGSAAQHLEIFSYLTMQDYDAVSAIAQNQDYSGMAPDFLFGVGNAEIMHGMQRKADIITNGDDDIILAGSGGGLINTGVGKDDVIFMPSAADGSRHDGRRLARHLDDRGRRAQRQAHPPGRPADPGRRGYATLNQMPMKSFRTQKRCADLVAGRTGPIQRLDVSWLYQIANESSGYHRKPSGGFTNSL